MHTKEFLAEQSPLSTESLSLRNGPGRRTLKRKCSGEPVGMPWACAHKESIRGAESTESLSLRNGPGLGNINFWAKNINFWAKNTSFWAKNINL